MRIVNERIAFLQKVLADLKESGANETKSTAGDKHETALAMLQIEQANVRSQLQDVLDKKTLLSTLNPSLTTVSIVNGSLVETNVGYLFISAALNKFSIEGSTIIPLSAKSPLGIKLMGLSAGEEVRMNTTTYSIKAIM